MPTPIPSRYDPTMGYEDQLQFLGRVMQKTKSLGMTMPRHMTSRITKTIPGAAGTFQAGWGAGSYRTPAQLKISPGIRYAPNDYQASVNVHELGHADDARNRDPRRISEARGVAYEQLVGPVVMRSLGSPVPDSFWRQQAAHPYRKEFGDAAIEKQKAYLRHKMGAALYDREDARLLQREIPKAQYKVVTFEDGSKLRMKMPSAAEEAAADRAFQRRKAIHEKYEKLKAKNPRPLPPYRGRN